MPVLRSRCSAAALLFVCVAAPAALAAQAPEATRVVTPLLDFSGVLYANYQFRSDSSARAQNGGKPASRFDVERVYLNFRMPVGERALIRVTTDIFSNTDGATNGYYKGYVARFKYAYLQFNVANDIAGVTGLNGTFRFGMLHTVTIDHEEGFWPRYLGQVGIERNGFFSSSDLGAAVVVALPKKMGEVYGTLTNGPGYTATETDRFKDFAARVSLTPWANSEAFGGWLKTFTISPWVYMGSTASRFQNGGPGQVGLVSDGLSRDRWGVFVGGKDRRLAFGLDYAERTETTEPASGQNTAAAPRTTLEVTGRLTSAFVIARPALLANAASKAANWGVLARLDDFKPNDAAGASTQFTTLSLFWEPTSKVTVSLDLQNQSRKSGSATPETQFVFLHWQAAF